MSERRSILLLCDDSRGHAGNVIQHIAALSKLSRHDVHLFNPVDRPESARLLDLEEFDVVVIHYTIMVTGSRYLSAELAEKIAQFRGLKMQFIQDEYRQVDAVTSRMRELGIDILYTCVPPPARDQIYGGRLPRTATVTTLAAYVPEELVSRTVKPASARPLDVGYRGRGVPYWLGRLGHEKIEIGRGFLARAGGCALRCDISSNEADRIYGERWYRFLASCRGTLGTESGSSIVDFDGSIEACVKDYLVRNAGATFDQVQRAILAAHEDNIRIAVVSPRIFEAAGLRTTMILFPGEYSGVVEPWTHYIPLARDFSNIDQVAERLRDQSFIEEMTKRTYDDLIASERYSLRRFVGSFDDLVDARSTAVGNGRRSSYARAARRRRIPSWRSSPRLRGLAGRMVMPVAGLFLVSRDPAVRRLVPGVLRDAELVGDLWRLAALRRSLQRGAFHVRSSLENGAHRLFLESRPGKGGGNGHTGVPALDETIHEIVWNHTAVGETVPLLGELIQARVGEDGVSGAHSFRALVRMSHRTPKPVSEAIASPPQRKGGG